MDNLTHSLIGAALGQAGLKRKTGLAMPALILAANLPDIDAPCVVFGVESLAMRRGLSHGPIALAVLPLLLAALLVRFDRWQARRGTRPERRAPVDPVWLVALCYLGTLTHPAFDWLNNYGIRLLEPFSSKWFYGDALFIVDPWMLAMLGAGLWLSLRRERAGRAAWTRPARAAIAGVMAYVALNLAISAQAVRSGRSVRPQAQLVVANAVPLAFWRRDILWRDANTAGSLGWAVGGPRGSGTAEPTSMDDPRIAAAARTDPKLKAFLFWSRMPIAQRLDHGGLRVVDQRFNGISSARPFAVELPPR